MKIKNSERAIITAAWILIGLGGFVVITFIFLSVFNRPAADDFRFGAEVGKGILPQAHNPISYAINFYENFTARASNILVNWFAYKLFSAQRVAQLTGLIMIFSLFSSILFFTSTVMKQLGEKKVAMISLLISIAASSSLLVADPYWHADTYWFPGFVSYVLPLVLTFFLAGWIMKFHHGLKNQALVFVGGLFIALFNEACAVELWLFFAPLIGYLFLTKSKRLLSFIILELALLVGIIFMLLSPGTRIRTQIYQSQFGTHGMSIIRLLHSAIPESNWYVHRLFVTHLPEVMGLVIPVVIATQLMDQSVRGRVKSLFLAKWWMAPVWLILGICGIYATFYVQAALFLKAGSPVIAKYSIIVSYIFAYVILAALIIVAVSLITHITRNVYWTEMVLAGVLTLIFVIYTMPRYVHSQKTIAKAMVNEYDWWNQRNALINAQKAKGVTRIDLDVDFDYIGEPTLQNDSSFWFNHRLAQWYDVESVTAKKSISNYQDEY